MIGKFYGREIIEKPVCPFCGMRVEKPRELEERTPQEMPVGRCTCGAVYAYDATGHNLGTAMVDALMFGCDGDWDLAWGLLPEEDYKENLVDHYDYESHLIVHSEAYEGRRVSGTLYFIRLHQDVREVTDSGSRRRLEKAAPHPERSSRKGKRRKKAFSKKEIEKLVREYSVEPLLKIAADDKRIIRDLQRLLYSGDKLARWKAADMLGKASAVIARRDPGTISRLLQGLFIAISDTAASSWGSLDAIGEIISHNPDQFGGYVPQIGFLMAEKHLWSEILRALANIGNKRPELVHKIAFRCIPLHEDPDPEIRGYAAIVLGYLEVNEAKEALHRLEEDTASVEMYKDGRVETKTIARLASDALKNQ